MSDCDTFSDKENIRQKIVQTRYHRVPTTHVVTRETKKHYRASPSRLFRRWKIFFTLGIEGEDFIWSLSPDKAEVL